MVHLIDFEALNLHPDAQVIRAEDYQVYLDAQQVLDQAREKAAEIEAAAQAEFEKQRELGRQLGMAEGKREIAERMIETVGRTVDYFSGIEETMADLVAKGIRKIISEMDDRERIMGVVKTSLAMVRSERKVLVRLSPLDADAVKSQMDELTRAYPNVSFLEVTADPRLEKGACILETEMGVVDASVETQLQAIRNSLVKSLGAAHLRESH
ncbi:MAG: HrpE/YscL family type III secretion apparatus protein [Planctomycetaceae bacterium]|nr:HrpE/YscL family type III secretion apparatus protein [Planctomycetaceae bacterium]